MRIELRDETGARIGKIEVDPARRPTRAAIADSTREVFLDWETAQDDAGRLRRCIACGGAELYHQKAFPQVTGFVVVLAFAGAAVGTLGLATTPPVLIAMCVVLVIDIAILLFSKRRLVCYRCHSSYHDLPIARYHRGWDRALAERYPAPDPRRETDKAAADDRTAPRTAPAPQAGGTTRR